MREIGITVFLDIYYVTHLYQVEMSSSLFDLKIKCYMIGLQMSVTKVQKSWYRLYKP